jgi:hypothetical protein
VTTHRARKQNTRQRMAETGENYTTAAGKLAADPDATYKAKAPEGVRYGGLDDGADVDTDGVDFNLVNAYTADWDGDLRNDYTPEGAVHDNTVRAGFALGALEAFTDRVGLDDDSAVSDLLCDLRHLCDALGLDFDAEVARGTGHYNAEIRAEF